MTPKRRSFLSALFFTSFCVTKLLLIKTLLPSKFSLPCDETSTRFSPLPGLTTFSLIFIVLLNLKCRKSTGYFKLQVQ